jgi:hypothetical protein
VLDDRLQRGQEALALHGWQDGEQEGVNIPRPRLSSFQQPPPFVGQVEYFGPSVLPAPVPPVQSVSPDAYRRVVKPT